MLKYFTPAQTYGVLSLRLVFDREGNGVLQAMTECDELFASGSATIQNVRDIVRAAFWRSEMLTIRHDYRIDFNDRIY